MDPRTVFKYTQHRQPGRHGTCRAECTSEFDYHFPLDFFPFNHRENLVFHEAWISDLDSLTNYGRFNARFLRNRGNQEKGRKVPARRRKRTSLTFLTSLPFHLINSVLAGRWGKIPGEIGGHLLLLLLLSVEPLMVPDDGKIRIFTSHIFR